MAYVPTLSGAVSVTESDEDISAQVCVQLRDVMSGLERDVVVNLSTVVGTASKCYVT